MPELPEVETVRRGLNHLTLNQPIVQGQVCLDRTVAHPEDPQQFVQSLLGCQISQWQRRGKYLLAVLQKAQQPAGILGVHLRMTGQLFWLNPEEPLQTHTRVRLWFDSGQELRFVDIRTFGQMWYVPASATPEHCISGLATLGPEPFSADFSAAYLQARFQKSQRPVKNALLDQRLIAGLGNIYADEALFLSQIRPTTATQKLKVSQLERLCESIRTVLTESLEHGGTTLRDFRDVRGINGNYGGIARVYRRTGQPCPVCQTPIERIKLAGRSTHFCPQCQP